MNLHAHPQAREGFIVILSSFESFNEGCPYPEPYKSFLGLGRQSYPNQPILMTPPYPHEHHESLYSSPVIELAELLRWQIILVSDIPNIIGSPHKIYKCLQRRDEILKSSGGVRRPGMVHGKESWARRCGRLDSSSAQRNPHVLTIDLINMPPKEPPQKS